MRYQSGVDAGTVGIEIGNMVRWIVFGVCVALSLVCLIWREALGLGKTEAIFFSYWLMIISQFVSISIAVLRGIKLLRYASLQLGDSN